MVNGKRMRMRNRKNGRGREPLIIVKIY